MYIVDQPDAALATDSEKAAREIGQYLFKENAETLEEIEGRVYPCGGTGWRRAIFLDMTDPNEVCPVLLRYTSESLH